MSHPIAWTIPVRITDHGRWLPDDERRAGNLIAAVNAWRKPDNPKPKIRRDYDGRTCLDITIGDTTIWLRPGDHLVRLEAPRVTSWECHQPEELAELFPEEWPS